MIKDIKIENVKKLIKAKLGEEYQFVNAEGKVEQNITFKIVDNNLYVYKNNEEEPSVIIEDYKNSKFHVHENANFVNNQNLNSEVFDKNFLILDGDKTPVLAEEIIQQSTQTSNGLNGYVIGGGIALLTTAGLAFGLSKKSNDNHSKHPLNVEENKDLDSENPPSPPIIKEELKISINNITEDNILTKQESKNLVSIHGKIENIHLSPADGVLKLFVDDKQLFFKNDTKIAISKEGEFLIEFKDLDNLIILSFEDEKQETPHVLKMIIEKPNGEIVAESAKNYVVSKTIDEGEENNTTSPNGEVTEETSNTDTIEINNKPNNESTSPKEDGTKPVVTLLNINDDNEILPDNGSNGFWSKDKTSLSYKIDGLKEGEKAIVKVYHTNDKDVLVFEESENGTFVKKLSFDDKKEIKAGAENLDDNPLEIYSKSGDFYLETKILDVENHEVANLTSNKIFASYMLNSGKTDANSYYDYDVRPVRVLDDNDNTFILMKKLDVRGMRGADTFIIDVNKNASTSDIPELQSGKNSKIADFGNDDKIILTTDLLKSYEWGKDKESFSESNIKLEKPLSNTNEWSLKYAYDGGEETIAIIKLENGIDYLNQDISNFASII